MNKIVNKRFVKDVLIAGIIGLITCFASAFVIVMYNHEFDSSAKDFRNILENKLCVTFHYECKDIPMSEERMHEEFWIYMEGKT
jgi:hypothetical protein